MRLLVQGVAADNKLLATTVIGLRRWKAWLLERVEHARTPTDCGLAAEVAAVVIPAGQSTTEEGAVIDEPEARQLDATVKLLVGLTQRYLIACACAAINPSCPTCADDAVLLAGIDVLDCEVEDICQVVRHYAASGPNLRDWIPPLTWLPKILEELCCNDLLRKPVPDKDTGADRDAGTGKMIATGQTSGFLAAARRQAGGRAGASLRDRVLLTLGEELSVLDPTGRGAAMLAPVLSPTALREDLVRAASRSPDVREVVGAIAADAVGDQLGDVRVANRRQLEEVVAELTGAVAIDREVNTAVSGQMSAVRRDLGQYKSQTSRQLGRLESAVRERLTELEQELAEVRRLRDSLTQAHPPATPTETPPPETPAEAPPETPAGTPDETPAETPPEAEPERQRVESETQEGGARRRGGRGSRSGGGGGSGSGSGSKSGNRNRKGDRS
jgi:uncharacterized membrane protein YgcG